MKKCNSRSFHNNRRSQLSPGQLQDVKSKSMCRTCSNYGYWALDHHSDGRLRPGALPSSTPQQGQPIATYGTLKIIISFATETDVNVSSPPSQVRPAINTGDVRNVDDTEIKYKPSLTKSETCSMRAESDQINLIQTPNTVHPNSMVPDHYQDPKDKTDNLLDNFDGQVV